jgi:ADP-heptose:LPS heptosyltransferase
MRKPYQRDSLILKPVGGGIGDELMCLPVFEEIKRRNPACRITFVTRRPDFFREHPAIDAVCEESPRALTLAYHYALPPPRPLMTLMSECAGIIGDFTKINAPPLRPSDEVRALIDALPRLPVVIQPLASQWTTNKSWPLESWELLIRDLLKDGPVLEIGTEPAFPAETFPPGFVSMAGRTTIEDLAYVISRARLFIGPSSGGMHLANAYGVKSVIIFGGYESPEGYHYPFASALYTPVECAPCWRQTCPYNLKCLRAITPERVASEARRALG